MKSIISKLAGLFPNLRSREFRVERFDFYSGLGDSAWLLYGLARSKKPKVCVEIGSARGKSACFIGLALLRNGGGKLYAIDPHNPTDWNDTNAVDSFPIINRHLQAAGVAEFVEIIRKTSVDAAKDWKQKIDLIFIDGDHSYEGVKRDWELFLPYLSEFGVVVFHDTIWDLKTKGKPRSFEDGFQGTQADLDKLNKNLAMMGVPRFVDELRAAGYPVITIDQDCGVTLVQPRLGGVELKYRSP